jgi:hypothetical protein
MVQIISDLRTIGPELSDRRRRCGRRTHREPFRSPVTAVGVDVWAAPGDRYGMSIGLPAGPGCLRYGISLTPAAASDRRLRQAPFRVDTVSGVVWNFPKAASCVQRCSGRRRSGSALNPRGHGAAWICCLRPRAKHMWSVPLAETSRRGTSQDGHRCTGGTAVILVGPVELTRS